MKPIFIKFKTLSTILGLSLLFSSSANADWALDAKHSNLNFISVKNGAVVESHEFTELEGHIDANGQATLNVNLKSVETLIPIRNERMGAMLFASNKFPTASITIQLDESILKNLASAGTSQIEVAGQLTISGETKRISASLLVNSLNDGDVQVSTAKPILLNASDFGLLPGIEALRAIAGLNSIAAVVPVTFNLSFTPAAPQRKHAESKPKPDQLIL